jgi:hypothetical protein
MKAAIATTFLTTIMLAGTAASAQTVNLQNPGTSTTPGVTMSTVPSTPTVTIQNVQNLPVGPQPQPGQQPGTQLSPLGFSSINTTQPVVMPNSRFASANVLSTVAPQPTPAQPLPTATSTTTTSNTLSPTMATFTFTPSQQFAPITTPRPFAPPSLTPFQAK